MRKEVLIIGILIICCLLIWMMCNLVKNQSQAIAEEEFQPLSFEQAEQKADSVLALMTLAEKIALLGGDKSFFIRALPRLNLNEIYMTDATQGVHIREQFKDIDLSDYQLKKSTAFPCPIALAATWNPELAYQYAKAVGEECRAGGIGILLGPGLNQYRHSQCGRNFEYFGEDPYLRSRLIEQYVKGVQSTGTVATLKHFIANNTEYYRRKSNSIIGERTLHEIYLPPFKAGIDAGVKAVMTSYNLLNGEWCGQSEYAIKKLLRNQLGFKWLVMTDWSSVWDGEKVVKSGQNLEMPEAVTLSVLPQLIEDGKVNIADVDRMAKGILRTCFAMRLFEREKAPQYYAKFPEHELVARETAREGIVLLKNEDKILPLRSGVKSILVTGDYVREIARGGGSAFVEGYNNRTMLDELKQEFGNRIKYVENPTIEEIQSAEIVLCNIGTNDSEGYDRPFELPVNQEHRVIKCVTNNPHTVVIVTSGSGVRMTDWSEQAKAIIYAWYGGQIGNQALVEIIAGKTNPSGKLPITIEKEFKDSPGFGYLPEGESLYSDWDGEGERLHPVYDVHYSEGVFVGYRWYESRNIEPLYYFGHGLSYTNFEYSNLKVSKSKFSDTESITVSLEIKNTGLTKGKETVQLYIEDVACSEPRPLKELKAFQKVELEPGKSKTVTFQLNRQHFSFWHPRIGSWLAEKGKFILHLGSSVSDIRLKQELELI